MEPLKQVKFIVIHHSQRKIDSVKRIKNLHVKINKWDDIGYHFLIGKNGKLYNGRSEKFIGAHVFGHNKNSIGICLIGNFDEEAPTKKQMQNLIKFLKEKIKKYKIPAKNILGHREFPNVIKTCPGKFIDMNEIRAISRRTKLYN